MPLLRRHALLPVRLSSALAFFAAVAQAQQVTPEDAQDPLTQLRGMTFQNNVDFGFGAEDRTGYTLLLQPWQADIGKGAWLRLRSLAGLPLIYRPGSSPGEGGTFGLGDLEGSFFWAPRKTGGALVGVGPILRFPLATDARLGSGKWSAGVTVAAIARPRGWLVGFRTYNIWSFAGAEHRPDVNQFFLQYLVLRSLGSGGWYVISAPKMTSNWDAPSGNRWLVPFGGGAGKLFRMGRRGLDVQASVFYNAVRPEDLPSARWTLRVQLQLLFAS